MVNRMRFRFGKTRALLSILALVVISLGGAQEVLMATSTTTTHTRIKVTTTETLTETTTAINNAIGTKGVLILLVLLAMAASLAVILGYVWGRKRARKDLLGA